MKHANIEKAGQAQQQNQTTTNINYIKNYVRFKSKT